VRWVSEAGLTARLQELAASEPRVVVSGNHATPHAALRILDAALPRYRLFTLNAQPGLPDRDGVVHDTPFVGPGVRRSPRLSYVPARLSLVPRLFATTYVPDLVLVHVAPPRGGKVSLGVEVNILPAAVEQARARGGLVVAQVNPCMPWTYGDAELDLEQVDLALEVDAPLIEAPVRVPSPLAQEIAGRVAALVHDGATLQLGIGGVPDATLTAVRGRRGLRVWSEMVSDGLLDLDRAGALDPAGEVVASFLFGSAELYRWADDNRRLHMRRTEITNDPARISRCRLMTSVNSAVQVDLFAQANASWVGGRVHSGLGGQPDFVVGALHAPGGQAVIALPSWHPKADCSTVVPRLDTPVTSSQHTWVVSEQGSASIFGHSQSEQTAALVRHVAHPDAREELSAAAVRFGLCARGPQP
jgi:acyl-CoA hydrolase